MAPRSRASSSSATIFELTPSPRPNSHSLALHLLRRAWLVVLMATLAGVTAWLTVSGQNDVYEAKVTSVLRPAPSLDAAEVPDAVRNLSSDSGQLRTTV